LEHTGWQKRTELKKRGSAPLIHFFKETALKHIQAGGPSRLEFTLKPKNGGTLLSMAHPKAPAEQAELYDEGWKDNCWELMEKHFQNAKKRQG